MEKNLAAEDIIVDTKSKLEKKSEAYEKLEKESKNKDNENADLKWNIDKKMENAKVHFNPIREDLFKLGQTESQVEARILEMAENIKSDLKKVDIVQEKDDDEEMGTS